MHAKINAAMHEHYAYISELRGADENEDTSNAYKKNITRAIWFEEASFYSVFFFAWLLCA